MTNAKQKQHAMATLRRMRRKSLLRITGETAEVFGVIAAKLTKRGRSADFRVHDLWLAAQAVERDFTVLTANAKDFKDVSGIEVCGGKERVSTRAKHLSAGSKKALIFWATTSPEGTSRGPDGLGSLYCTCAPAL